MAAINHPFIFLEMDFQTILQALWAQDVQEVWSIYIILTHLFIIKLTLKLYLYSFFPPSFYIYM